MPSYKCLKVQEFHSDEYSLVPVRYEDRLNIMKWRNKQIYHLRQSKPLTEEDQEHYFKNVVAKLFDQEQPDQILFSYLENDTCIGYGGLVHINWLDRNAEMSFLVNTEIIDQPARYCIDFSIYIKLIKEVCFSFLKFNKLYTETYDIRKQHIGILENNNFLFEGRLRKHILIGNTYYDSLFHSVLKEEYEQNNPDFK